jgi:redox-sensitive bicupin YhaK (pirin superfamily)
VYAGLFNGTQSGRLELNSQRKAYVHLISGQLEINGQKLDSGDALLFENESQIIIKNGRQAEVLIFDLLA